MSNELFYLVCTAILTMLLWLPHVGYKILVLRLPAADYQRAISIDDWPLWTQRSCRAHQNLIENIAIFAILILTLEITGLSNEWTNTLAGVYFWVRLLHAVVHIAGVAYLRTVLFLTSWACLAALALELLY
jgi:uncharacterized MAPEG superfamily protein